MSEQHWTDRIASVTAARCARDPEATPDTTPEDIAIALMGGIDTVGLHRDDVIERIADAIADAEAERDELQRLVTEGTLAICERAELRRILEPLLDHPVVFDSRDGDNCTFCVHHGQEWSWIEPVRHRPDCPVLRKDALLGPDRAPE